jgi:glycolate oxidase iron-sulfur subunit
MPAAIEQIESFLDEKKALACVHCGLCLASCPTYLETGNENDSPRGRIYLMRSIQQGRLSLDATVSPAEHIDRCLGCRACETACPSGVQYGALLEHTRDHMEHTMRRPWFQRLLRRVMIEKVFPYPNRFRLALIPAVWAKRMDIGHLLPHFLREALNLAPDSLELRNLPEFSPSENLPSKGRVGMVSGCVMPVLFGGTHQSTIRLLNRLGYDVVIPRDQVCCGALYAHSGQLDMARGVARVNLQAFDRADCDTILINAAGCGSTLKEYHHLLEGDSRERDAAEQFVGKVRDLSEWMDEVGWKALDALLEKGRRLACGEKTTSPASLFGRPTTFHDACHLAHAQGITRQPRDLVKAVAGEYYVELPESEICCGSAGSYNLTEPDMAGRLQRRKVSHIRKTEAHIVVTTNPGCILQIESGLKQQGYVEVRVMHLADYLEAALQEAERL